MIRFIDLRNQGTYTRFAFWDTTVDRFITIDGEQAWDDREELVEAVQSDGVQKGQNQKTIDSRRERLTSLMPAWADVNDGLGEEKWETEL